MTGEWIKASEGLPDRLEHTYGTSVDVLVYAPESRNAFEYWGSAWYDYQEKCWKDATSDELVFGVTHWMSLPEPPRDGTP